MVLPPQKQHTDNVVHIRLVEREDLDDLFALDQACFRVGIAYSRAELRYFLFHPRSLSIIAENTAGIAGFAIAEFFAEKSGRAGHVVTIDVAAKQRRQGVGRLLMETLLDACRKAGAVRMGLEVAVDNHAAIKFYKMLGFQETGRIRGFYMGTLDALKMEKVLNAR